MTYINRHKKQNAKNIAVIGGGPMGLAVAYQLALDGNKVFIYEADNRLGGMTASFKFSDILIERYYHFHCLSDNDFFKLLKELRIEGNMKWRKTTMGFFMDNKLYKWGSVGSVLSFKRIPFSTRLRYLLHAFRCLTLKNWAHLDYIAAKTWLKVWLGEKGYKVLWENLFKYKFYEYSDSISAAWIWSRIRRLGLSRRFFKEYLGYFEGGSEMWIKELELKLNQLGCEIFLSKKVHGLKSHNKVIELIHDSGSTYFDAVVSTIPIPLIPNILKYGKYNKDIINRYSSLKSIACACVILETSKKISNNFWTNINDERFKIPGIIEYTNLRDIGRFISYIPFYMPYENEAYKRPDSYFINDSIQCIKAINPSIVDTDILNSYCNRYKYAQPIYNPSFSIRLPDINPFENIWIADTTYYYPEDRGISESIGFGRRIAKEVNNKLNNNI